MSRLITRITSRLCKIKKDGLLYSVKARSPALTKTVGVGIAAITTVTATTLMSLALQDSKDTTEKIKTNQGIYNLEEIVKNKARELYKKDGKRRLFGKENLVLCWEDVELVPTKVNYRRDITKELFDEMYRVLLTTEVENETEAPQEHRLRTQRQIHTVCEWVLSSGYSMGTNIDLSIPVPKTGIFLSSEIKLTNQKRNAEEKIDTWTMDDFIKIPKKTKIKVTVQTKENKPHFDFDAKVGFKGNVKGTFYNKHHQILHTATIPIDDVIFDSIPECMRETKEGIIYIKIAGKVSYSNDVNHVTKIAGTKICR